MEAPKQEDSKPIEGLQEQEEQEEQVTGKNRQNLNQRLIASAKKNQYEEVQKCLKKKADINYQENTKKKWTALIWACCMGHTKIVKLLLSRSAGQPYMEIKPENRHIAIGSTKQLKPNPLHWACFKGHLDVTYILLKAGFHWEDIDGSGNNSVMLSAAGNSVDIFKTFLQYGVSISCKNSRGHVVKDLTTHHEILALANKYQNSKQCAISKQHFQQKDIKYWCWVCTQFVNGQNFKMQWALKCLGVTQKQKIDGRCKKCWSQNQQMRKQLQQAIEKYQESNMKKVLDKYSKRQNQIQITFLTECIRIMHKLQVQNGILNFIKNLSKIQDYKIILKSVNKIHQMLKDAQPIKIDANVVDYAQKQIGRLNAQRNLRFQIDNIDTSVATREGVAKLDQIFDIAQKSGVAAEYLQVADSIKSKMKRSILAQDLYQQFVDYPIRPDPYPDPLVIDFKSKKPLDPETKKPTDPVNLLPKKKKGNKKGPSFQIPEWANDLKQMNQKIKQCEQLLVAREELGLGKDFCIKTEQIIVLMKKQSRYRKDMDTLQAMVDEANKKKK